MATTNYTRVNWKDYPETDTPITANNLNKMDEGIYNLGTDIGDMDLIKDSGDGTVCKSLSLALGIKVYVNEEDGLLHFIDGTGADTALPFSGKGNWKLVVTVSFGASARCRWGLDETVLSTRTSGSFDVTVLCQDGEVTVSGSASGSAPNGEAFTGETKAQYCLLENVNASLTIKSFEWL